jgi:hypothetical protein
MIKIGKISSAEILLDTLIDFLKRCDEDDLLVILGKATDTEIYKNHRTEEYEVYASEEYGNIFDDILDKNDLSSEDIEAGTEFEV